MKYRVDAKYWYVIYDESDRDKAWELFRREGTVISECEGFNDRGRILAINSDGRETTNVDEAWDD